MPDPRDFLGMPGPRGEKGPSRRQPSPPAPLPEGEGRTATTTAGPDGAPFEFLRNSYPHSAPPDGDGKGKGVGQDARPTGKVERIARLPFGKLRAVSLSNRKAWPTGFLGCATLRDKEGPAAGLFT